MHRLLARLGLVAAVMLAITSPASRVAAQGAVQQSGPVTAFHAGAWAGNGFLTDGGMPASPGLSALGVYDGSQCPFGVSSQTGPGYWKTPYSLFTVCQTDTTSTLKFAGLNGHANPTVLFNIGGVNYGFPGPGNGNVMGPPSSINNDFACFNTTSGSLLLDCGTIDSQLVTAVVAGPYTGQVAQPLSGAAPPGCMSVFSWISPAEQAAVQAGTSTTDYVPIEHAMETALAVNAVGVLNGTNCLYFPPGAYPLTTAPINFKHTLRFQGAGVGQAGGYATVFTVPANATGAIVNRSNTLGNGTVTATTGADGTLIDGVSFQSAGGTIASGISCRARCSIDNVDIEGFKGNAINIVATAGSGGVTEGNANGWYVGKVRLVGNGLNGIYTAGADANGGKADGPIDCSTFQGYCIDDESFLGNQYDAPQCAGCGLGALVNQSGVSYYLNPTSSGTAGAATTPGTNPAVWVALSSFISAYPAWSSSGVYMPGGGYRCGNNNASTVFINAYDESGDAPSYGVHPCVAIGGKTAPGWTGDVSYVTNSLGAYVNTAGPMGSKTIGTTTTVTAVVGGEPNNGTGLEIADSGTSPAFASGWRIRIIGPDMYNDVANGSGSRYWTETGGTTAITFGRTAAVPWAFSPTDFMLGDDGGFATTARHFFYCNGAAPTTTGHAYGETCLNKAPAIGQPVGWTLTTQGSPDTWAAMPTLTGQAGVSCSGTPTSSFATVDGVVTHC